MAKSRCNLILALNHLFYSYWQYAAVVPYWPHQWLSFFHRAQLISTVRYFRTVQPLPLLSAFVNNGVGYPYRLCHIERSRKGNVTHSAPCGRAVKTDTSPITIGGFVSPPFSEYSVVSRRNFHAESLDEISETPVFMRLSDLVLL